MCITLRNCDCLEYMRALPDDYYDVCIADPPYGIGRDWEKWADYDGCEIEPMFFEATMGRIKEDVRYSRADVRFVDKDGKEIEWGRRAQRVTAYAGTTQAEGCEQAGTPQPA